MSVSAIKLAPVMQSVPAIKIEQVHKRFGDLHVLKGIDLTINQGEFFGLLGPNGAGKSTLINILAGLLKSSHGNIAIMGHDVVKDYQAARLALGVVPQELVFDPFFNVREMLRFQAGYFGRGRENDAWVDEIIESLGLTDKAHTNMRKLWCINRQLLFWMSPRLAWMLSCANCCGNSLKNSIAMGTPLF